MQLGVHFVVASPAVEEEVEYLKRMRAPLWRGVFFHHFEGCCRRHHIDGKEVEEGHGVIGVGILAVVAEHVHEEKHHHDADNGDEDGAYAYGALLVENEEHGDEEEEEHAFLHDGDGTHDARYYYRRQLPQRHLGVLP